MKTAGVWRQLVVGLTTLITLVTNTIVHGRCSSNIRLDRNQTVYIDVTHSNHTTPLLELGRTCVADIRTVPGWRVVLTVDYIPGISFTRVSENCHSSSSYLLVGNDYTAVGNELMTSYKYCREVSGTEIVSRDRRLWVVLKDAASHPSRLRFTVRSLPQVICQNDEMQCSPVQCVHGSFVCNGRPDCLNGLDEYCYYLANVSAAREEEKTNAEAHVLQTESRISSELEQPATGVLAEGSVPPEGSACFLCRDGTCILPRVERYDRRWGVWLWYLCDGVQHCPDGWDENAYMCYYFKYFPKRLDKDLFQCEAFDLPTSLSRQVRMWSLARCDAKRDCRQEHEEGGDKCQTRQPHAEFHLHLEALTLAAVLTFQLVIIACALFVFRHLGRQDLVSEDQQSKPHSDCLTLSDLQSCITTRPAELSTIKESDANVAPSGVEVLQILTVKLSAAVRETSV